MFFKTFSKSSIDHHVSLLIGMILISYSVHMLLGLYIIHVSINVGKSPKQYSGSEIIRMDGILGLEARRFIYFLGDS